MECGRRHILNILENERLQKDLSREVALWIVACRGGVPDNHVISYAQKVQEIFDQAFVKYPLTIFLFGDESLDVIEVDGLMSLQIDSDTRSVKVMNGWLVERQIHVSQIQQIGSWYN